MKIAKFIAVLTTFVLATTTYAAEPFTPISFEKGEEHYTMTLQETATKVVTASAVESELATDGVRLLDTSFMGSEVHLTFAPAEGYANWDLSDPTELLAFDIYNKGDNISRVFIGFQNANGTSRYFRVTTAPNSSTTVYCLTDDTQRGLGMLTIPYVGDEVYTVSQLGWGPTDFDMSDITKLMFRADNADLAFDNFRIVENPYVDPSTSLAGLIDQYGQHALLDWDTKIYSDEDLLAAAAREDEELIRMIAENEARGDRTVYGGWKNEEYKQEATGSFYTTKINDQWTIIDPEGYPYFSTGVDIVRITDARTWIAGREYMFTDLPAKNSELGDHYQSGTSTPGIPIGAPASGDQFNFYSANLERKYGDDWENERAAKAVERFKAWGMTTIGAWSEKHLFYGSGEQYNMPYVAFILSAGWPNSNVAKLNGVPDPFDPSFEKAFRANVVYYAGQYGVDEDVFCMGVYVDNEFGWGQSVAVSPVVNAVFSVDATATTAYAKRHFIEVFVDKYETVENLNAAWGSSFETWEDLNAPYSGSIAEEDRSLILYEVADGYYTTVHDALEELMPNTMYLGSRNTEWGTPVEVIRAAANHVDILSFNCYRDIPIREKFSYGEYDLPIIIGEFNFTTTENNGMIGIHETPQNTEAERAQSYQTYIEAALKSGNIVGAHWFQYYDQPLTGRAWDGENSGSGFVSITDQPYTQLVDAAREIHAQMYDIKFGFEPLLEIELVENAIELQAIGMKHQLEVNTIPVDFSELVFESSHNHIATVSSDGVVTGVSIGEATITVRSKYDLQTIAQCVVTVDNTK